MFQVIMALMANPGSGQDWPELWRLTARLDVMKNNEDSRARVWYIILTNIPVVFKTSHVRWIEYIMFDITWFWVLCSFWLSSPFSESVVHLDPSSSEAIFLVLIFVASVVPTVTVKGPPSTHIFQMGWNHQLDDPYQTTSVFFLWLKKSGISEAKNPL